MKFSILTLLSATGYFALAFMALTQSESLWKFVAGSAWLVIVAYLLILANDPTDRASSQFGRVALGCIAAYFALAAIAIITKEVEPRRLWNVLPHQWLTWKWTNSEYFKNSVDSSRTMVVARNTIEPLFAYNTALVFGMLAGSAAVIRYRRSLRRAELKERSGA